mgnify:CR=1 FL=1
MFIEPSSFHNSPELRRSGIGPNMPPLRGWAGLCAVFYKHAAPTELTNGDSDSGRGLLPSLAAAVDSQ